MARWKVCACTSCSAHPGSCPELTQARRCGDCAGQAERRRGSRHTRGYGNDHDARRQALLEQWTPGAPCPKCQRPQWDPDLLDAGHSTNLRDDPTAVADQLECRGCNRGWRKGAQT